ncbi:MAG TPA: tetratricopeptide repeat protein, partial [Candidatus Dormibacteraeota bacterium]|nr:tetratricopeptide repeat protein [Candidatus Dormibacteraeota bacterium]
AEDPADDATLPSPVEAPPAPGAELVAEGRRRYEAGDHADAEPLARRALELRPPGSDPAARSEALQLLGEVCYGRGRYAEARALADEAAALRAGAPDEDRAETENLQGILDLALGDHERGLERVRHAYELREAALGPDHADTLESLNNTGVALGRVDRMDEAIAAHEEALRRCERAFSAPHRQLAVSLNAIAVKLDKAEETRERAHELAVRALEAAEAALGPEHPLVATLTSNLATQRLNADDVEAARAYVERSIDLHERRHGPDHPNTATALLTAAAIAMRDGRATDARDLFERVVATRLDAFGLADRRTKVAVAGLVNASASLLQTDPSVEHEAVALFGVYRNLDDEKARSGPLGFGKADPAEAERALRAYLARAAERRPTEDPAVRRALDQATASMMSADASFMAGDLDAATVALEVAIERIEGAKGTESLLLIEPLHRLAAIERVRSARDRAIDVDRRALAILAAAYGERHPYVMGGIAGLAMETAAEWGPAAARPEMERLLEVVSSAEGGIAGRLRATIERQLELL